MSFWSNFELIHGLLADDHKWSIYAQ